VTAPLVTAVVVAWNPGDSLHACIECLRASAHAAAIGLQIVIVDNASTDSAVASVPLESGDVVVRNPVNAGYGAAAAQGISRAGAAWVLLVNPDCRVEIGFLPAMAAAIRSATADVATLVPDMRFASSPTVVNCRGIGVDEAGVPFEIGAGTDAMAAPVPDEPFGGSSGCCLLRTEALRAVGGVEVAFFAYLEDVDLAWQLRRAGFRAVFVPEAVALHEGSASTREGSTLKTYLVARNRRLLFRLDGPGGARARLWRLVVEAGHGTVATATGSGFAGWRGRAAALRLRRYAAFVRRARMVAQPTTTSPRLEPRATLPATLKRKLALRRDLHR
jgi:N-acetylglucosaminyl-diphospho-decaprenol L-rhamnosyltransferase